MNQIKTHGVNSFDIERRELRMKNSGIRRER